MKSYEVVYQFYPFKFYKSTFSITISVVLYINPIHLNDIIFQFILSYIHKFSHPSHFFHIWSINKSYKFYFLSIPLQQSPSCMLNMLLSVLCIQSYSTFCDPMDGSPPDSSNHRIFQARILEWVAISSSSRGSS